MNQDILKNWDRFINWGKRLHYEIPFFKEIFDRHGTRKVLDACCGSARHALEFSRMGMDVVGIDCSDEILDSARENIKRAGIDMPLYKEDILDLSRFATDEFDAVVCTGNSLALLDSLDDVRKALYNFDRILKKGGDIIIHLLDLNKLEETGQFMMPVISIKEDDAERILCRVFHVEHDSSYVTFVLLEKKHDKWEGRSCRQNLVRISQCDMKKVFQDLHYEKVDFFSSFKKHPFDDKTSTEMIITAKK